MNIKGMIVAELNRKRVEAVGRVEALDKLIAEFGSGNGKSPVKRHRRTKAEMAGNGAEPVADSGPKLSRSEKMKLRWAERKARQAAEKGESTQTEGADLAAAAVD